MKRFSSDSIFLLLLLVLFTPYAMGSDEKEKSMSNTELNSILKDSYFKINEKLSMDHRSDSIFNRDYSRKVNSRGLKVECKIGLDTSSSPVFSVFGSENAQKFEAPFGAVAKVKKVVSEPYYFGTIKYSIFVDIDSRNKITPGRIDCRRERTGDDLSYRTESAGDYSQPADVTLTELLENSEGKLSFFDGAKKDDSCISKLTSEPNCIFPGNAEDFCSKIRGNTGVLNEKIDCFTKSQETTTKSFAISLCFGGWSPPPANAVHPVCGRIYPNSRINDSGLLKEPSLNFKKEINNPSSKTTPK